MCKKESYVVSAVIVLAVVVVMFFPVMGNAGDLEPDAAPAPTMKTLDQIPPTWNIKIPGAERFAVLADFNNQAVLDKETGLVWEQSPSATMLNWLDAIYICATNEVGGRKGWHLPTIEQLASLVDTSVSGLPGSTTLPVGHPFTNVQSSAYWSVSTYANVAASAWYVLFVDGYVLPYTKTGSAYRWCVRGGQGYDGQ